MTLIDQIKTSCHNDDLDAALLPIQELLGVTDGGHASMFWSGPFGDAWPDQSPEARRKELLNYIDEALDAHT